MFTAFFVIGFLYYYKLIDFRKAIQSMSTGEFLWVVVIFIIFFISDVSSRCLLSSLVDRVEKIEKGDHD